MDKGRAEFIIDKIRSIVENAQGVPLSTGKVMINKDEMLELLDGLSEVTSNELKVYREVTDKKAKILTEAREEAKEIIYEAEKGASRIRVTKRRNDDILNYKQDELSKEDKMALRTANDIYAASIIYTDEMLTEVDHLISNAYDTVEKEYERVMSVLKSKINGISENKAELMNSLNEMGKAERYGQILEISQLLSNELYREREKAKAKEKENALQFEFKFDEEAKKEAAATITRKRPEINPDRTQVKINIKKEKQPEIKIMPREEKNKIRSKKVIVSSGLDNKDDLPVEVYNSKEAAQKAGIHIDENTSALEIPRVHNKKKEKKDGTKTLL